MGIWGVFEQRDKEIWENNIRDVEKFWNILVSTDTKEFRFARSVERFSRELNKKIIVVSIVKNVQRQFLMKKIVWEYKNIETINNVMVAKIAKSPEL